MRTFGEEHGFRIVVQNSAQSPILDVLTIGHSIPADSNSFLAVDSKVVSKALLLKARDQVGIAIIAIN